MIRYLTKMQGQFWLLPLAGPKPVLSTTLVTSQLRPLCPIPRLISTSFPPRCWLQFPSSPGRRPGLTQSSPRPLSLPGHCLLLAPPQDAPCPAPTPPSASRRDTLPSLAPVPPPPAFFRFLSLAPALSLTLHPPTTRTRPAASPGRILVPPPASLPSPDPSYLRITSARQFPGQLGGVRLRLAPSRLQQS